MMENFNIGDTVELKSGSPTMTIKRVGDGGTVTCIWFVSGKQSIGHFPADTLKIVNMESDESE